ncbi:MAG: hypothetical protein NVS3B20_04210 [Polyangiales bacterium]
MRFASLLVQGTAVVVFGCSAARDADPPPLGQGGDGDSGLDHGAMFPDVGLLDPNKDNDGDGYLFRDDCNDHDPLVNPGAYEVVGDRVDNDCNGLIDEVDDCDKALFPESTSAMDFAKSLGLCRTTTREARGKNKRWGVIEAYLQTTDGKGAPEVEQFGLRQHWGEVVVPQAGSSMVALSTGSARTPGERGYLKPLSLAAPSVNENMAPPQWPRNSSGCPDPSRKTANDSVVLKLVMRVPTNAKSFAYDFDFYTSEYIEYVCSEYNDTFVALLSTRAAQQPSNAGNISFDKRGDPVNVNSVFFEVCSPGEKAGRSFACARGISELRGTGYEGDHMQDGATGWLQTHASVVPGEEIELSYMSWTTGDHHLQSAVLVDNFVWRAEGTTGAVTSRPR